MDGPERDSRLGAGSSDLLAVDGVKDANQLGDEGQDSGEAGRVGLAGAGGISAGSTVGGIVGKKQPHVAKKKVATGGQKAEVVDLATVRKKRQKTQRLGLATRGQKKARSKAYVEAVGASIGTMAFRLRWRENGKRQPPIYLSRVSNDVFAMIKQGNYEAFKEQLVVSHSAGAIRAGHTA